jgi:hypothetical protein
MLGVCFRVEGRGWIQDQWSWLFSNYGVTDIWERGTTADSDTNIYQNVISVKDASELPTERPVIVISPVDARYINPSRPLDLFDHPEDAIYLFGATHNVLNDEDDLGGRVPDDIIYIPTVKHEMFSHTAGYIVLHDRYVKRGNRFG